MDEKNKGFLILSDKRSNEITKCLINLRFETGANCILMADVVGHLIAKVGESCGLDLTTLISLQAGCFAATFEMSKYLGETNAINLNFHEGVAYDIYSANVGDNLFLLLIYDRKRSTSRIGMVWLYTKRAIRELLEIVSSSDTLQVGEVFDNEFSASLKDKLDSLFD